MMSRGATLNLTPWAHEALSLDEMTELGRRAVDMHVRIGVIGGGRPRGWKISVGSWAKNEQHQPVHDVTRYHQRGHLADLIHGAMDEYERLFVFTPDELATIQRQGAA